jgi:hypothetical protein
MILTLAKRLGGTGLAVRGSAALALLGLPRVPRDLDLITVEEGWDLPRVDGLFADLLGPVSTLGIWTDSPFPGVRVRAGELQIDVGLREPKLQAPRTLDGILVMPPESLFAEKLVACVEEPRRRDKDLADAALVLPLCAPSGLARLTEAMATARGVDVRQVAALLDRFPGIKSA